MTLSEWESVCSGVTNLYPSSEVLFSPESEIKSMMRIDHLELCVSVCVRVSHMHQHLH